MEYKFKKKWDEDTSINWWKECRIELNKIIDLYNNWQIQDDFDKDKAKFLLANIEYGKQTIGSKDGGSGYWDELDEMEKFVRKCTDIDSSELPKPPKDREVDLGGFSRRKEDIN